MVLFILYYKHNCLVNTDPDWGVTLDRAHCLSNDECLGMYKVKIIEGKHNLHALYHYQDEIKTYTVERDIHMRASQANRPKSTRNTL